MSSGTQKLVHRNSKYETAALWQPYQASDTQAGIGQHQPAAAAPAPAATATATATAATARNFQHPPTTTLILEPCWANEASLVAPILVGV